MVASSAPPARTGLLSDIRSGRSLKKASERKLPEKKDEPKTGGLFDVSAILKKSLDMRRNAAEGSDSDSESSDDDWD
jgi:hypothetical protein